MYIEDAVHKDLVVWLRQLVPFSFLPDGDRIRVFDRFSEMTDKRFGMKLHDARLLSVTDGIHAVTERVPNERRERPTETPLFNSDDSIKQN
jgi:hypothetical protein